MRCMAAFPGCGSTASKDLRSIPAMTACSNARTTKAARRLQQLRAGTRQDVRRQGEVTCRASPRVWHAAGDHIVDHELTRGQTWPPRINLLSRSLDFCASGFPKPDSNYVRNRT